MSNRKRLKLCLIGVVLGAVMFLLGGVGVVPAHSAPQQTAQLQPWLQKTACDYPVVVCTSHGAVVTSPSLLRTRARGDR